MALSARLAWAFAASTELWFDHVFNDATAWNLALGNGFTASREPPFDPAIFRTPGYPAFLAAVYAVFGHSVRAAFAAQAILDAASCLLIWRIASRRLEAGPARAVLLLAATYPFTIHAAGTLSPESLLVFLGLLFVATVDALPDSGGTRIVGACGLVFAALCWVKPILLPLPAFLAAAERLRGRTWGVALGRAAAVGVLGLALFAPWLLRNREAFGRPLLAGELGLVVWHGTRDRSPGTEEEIRGGFDAASSKPEDRYEATRRGFADSRALLEKDAGYMRAGLDSIRSHPVRGLVVDPLVRVPRLWVSVRHAQLPGWVGVGALAACVGYLALAAAGLRMLRDRLREFAAWWILPVALTLAYAAIHAEARYTLPARPTLLLLGGAALHAWFPGGKKSSGAAARAPDG